MLESQNEPCVFLSCPCSGIVSPPVLTKELGTACQNPHDDKGTWCRGWDPARGLHLCLVPLEGYLELLKIDSQCCWRAYMDPLMIDENHISSLSPVHIGIFQYPPW